jgi:hypothetical protein
MHQGFKSIGHLVAKTCTLQNMIPLSTNSLHHPLSYCRILKSFACSALRENVTNMKYWDYEWLVTTLYFSELFTLLTITRKKSTNKIRAQCISPVTESPQRPNSGLQYYCWNKKVYTGHQRKVCYSTVRRYTTEYNDAVQGLTDSMEFVHRSQHAMSSTATIKSDSAQLCTSGLWNHLEAHSWIFFQTSTISDKM